MITTVVFDLGGVLVDWNPRYLYRKIFSDEAEMEKFLSEVCTPAWNNELDKGRSFKEACTTLARQFPRYAREIEMYRTRWGEMIPRAVEGTAEILKSVKKNGYPVYALSNFSAETFPLAVGKFPFLKLFDGVVLSGEEKLVKPDPLIYQRLLNRYRLRADECLYIDDNATNIAEGKKQGLTGILFTSAENLRLQLLQYHIRLD